MLFTRAATMRLVTPDEALPGRAERPYAVPANHAALGTPLEGPWPAGLEVAYVALGCFWGAERVFWRLPGVHSTAVGYQGGHTPHPTYDEVCTGRTAHTEAVQVVYDPAQLTYRTLVARFLEAHDPTQGFRQGNDTGTQYRSALYWTSPEQRAVAGELIAAYQPALTARRFRAITTEVAAAEGRPFYYAEAYHQQYLHKNPNGYCGLGGTGVPCPV